jgi:hypothetical protein
MERLSGCTSTARGQGGTQTQAIGRSRGGLTTKIVALVDALGNLVRFVLQPGQQHDSAGVAPLLHDLAFDALLADKAFDSNALRADLDERDAYQLCCKPLSRRRRPHYSLNVNTP